MTTISGIVSNGVIVPSSPVPDGTLVEISFSSSQTCVEESTPRMTAREIRRLPREKRHEILAAAATLAEADYRDDRELTGFAAFSEEHFDDDDAEPR
jgi:hypothetical protein